MAESSQHPLPPPDGPVAGTENRPAAAGELRALPVTLAIAAAGGVLGIIGGLAWSAVAPRAVFVVASRGVAYVVNPETHAFIAADGWYAIIAVAGGALIGLAGYLLGVRRFGPLPAAGALVGATAAAFLAWWTGHHLGLASFRHLLGTSKPGALLHQPIELGARGALAFWPLAAGAVIGGIELVLALRARRQGPYLPVSPPSLAFRPDQYGPDQNGPGQNGSGAYGPGAYGPGAYGPAAYGPGAYGPGQNDGSDPSPSPGQHQAGGSPDQLDS
jgi:hypothetical protein